MSKAAVRFFLLMTLLLPLASCSGSSRIQSSGSDSALATGAPPTGSGSEPTLATGAPPTENTTAVEQPLPPGGGNPAITAAPLPVGGNGDGGSCLRVDWSGDAIPDGVGAMIKSVDFLPGTYQRADDQCSSTPACIDHVLRAPDPHCFLGVMPTDPDAKDRDQGDQVGVRVNGYVVCADQNAAECTSFKTSASQQAGSLTVARPTVQGTTPAPTSTSKDPSPGSGSDTTPPSTSASPGG